MKLSEVMGDHEPAVAAVVDCSKRQLAAAQKLQKAIQSGTVRDIEKLQVALGERLSESAGAVQAASEPIDFDAEAYLAAEGGFFDELASAAEAAGVRMFVRDGTIFCYPVLLKSEPSKQAVRIDKKIITTLRPEFLVKVLAGLQQKGARAKPEQILKRLWDAYPYAAAKSGVPPGQDVKLREIYAVFTLLPEVKGDYSELDFTRDIYYLDVSGLDRIGNQRASFSASTATREDAKSLLRFVDRDGHEKVYSRVRFSPVGAGDAGIAG